MGKDNLILRQLFLLAVFFIYRSKGCTSEDDCDSASICVKGKCISPCSISDCGKHTLCQGFNHVAKCTCEPGYHLTEQGCQPRDAPVTSTTTTVTSTTVESTAGGQSGSGTSTKAGCSSDVDCDSTSACKNQNCVSACTDAGCGPNSKCKGFDHVPHCFCDPGYELTEQGCQPSTGSGTSTKTSVTSTIVGSSSGDQSGGGTSINAGTGSGTSTTTTVTSTTVGSSSGDQSGVGTFPGCTSNVDCAPTYFCKNKNCVSVCTDEDCGPHSKCKGFNHVAYCTCLPGYELTEHGCQPITGSGTSTTTSVISTTVGSSSGDQSGGGTSKQPECTSNADCNSASACVNQNCVDTCLNAECGPNSQCMGFNHVAHCSCDPGYETTDQGCKPSKPSTGPETSPAVGPSPPNQSGGTKGALCAGKSCGDKKSENVIVSDLTSKPVPTKKCFLLVFCHEHQ